jgi:hypothetical protein
MNASLIPHSSATTSWGLLEDVIKAIEEEPRRFNWVAWIIDADMNPAKVDKDAGAPACGTLACVAGWTILLTQSRPNNYFAGSYSPSRAASSWFPRETHDNLLNLFLAIGDYVDETGNSIDRRGDETPAQYAARGITAIRLFMAKHEAVLKAHNINIPPREA